MANNPYINRQIIQAQGKIPAAQTVCVKSKDLMGLFNRGFSVLQKMGQSLMLPVSVLPAAGLLVALGRMLQGYDGVLKIIGDICFDGGIAIFQQLPVLFAVGVAIGFSGGAGTAALASVAGYFTLVNVLKVITKARGLELPIDTGVFGGVMIGFLSADLYNRFKDTRLPQFLGFFAGKRLIPILTAGAAILLGLLLGLIWPPIQSGIYNFGTWIMGTSMGPAVFTAVKRMLIPVGLHHVFYPPFLYQFGEYVTAAGEIVKGEATRYYAGDPTAGKFMASDYPIMLFGLPAASLAMYLRALPHKRKAIGGVMIASALTSIITGITEPIEFAFIFVAPILFVFHIILAFIGGALTSFFDVQLGYTFSASLIDLVLGWFNQKNAWSFLLIVGPIQAVLYFCAFYFGIKWFDLKTPGRENGPEADSEAVSNNTVALTFEEKTINILAALGGKANIKHLDACITRLRLEVADARKVDAERLRALGATGSVNIGGGNYQVIFGTDSDRIKDQLKALMESDFVTLRSPLKGNVVSLAQVPDEMFSQKMMGDGVALDPVDGKVYAPCDGVVTTIFHTNHAVAITTDQGVELLIHIGIDTVKMKGEGFKGFVKNEQRVKAGDLLIEFDLALVKAKAKSHLTPVVITNSADLKGVQVAAQGLVGVEHILLKVKV